MPYLILYLTIIHLLKNTLTFNWLATYTTICIITIIYRKGYLYCFISAFDITCEFRNNLGAHIQNLGLGYFDKSSQGYLLNTLTNDVADFEGILSHALLFTIKTAILGGVIVVGTFFIDTRIAVVQCILILISFIILHWSNYLVKRFSLEKRSLSSELVSVVMEYIKGFKVFRSHNMTDAQFDRLIKSLNQTKNLDTKIEKKLSVPVSTYSIIVSFLTPLVFLLGGTMLLNHAVTADTFIAFMVMSLAISVLLTTFEHYYIMLNDLKSATENLKRVMDIRPLSFPKTDFTLNNFDIKFKNISFSYDSVNEVLHNINFTAQQGTVTALIGHSGSGKTTITNLISRFWDATKGEILIGDESLRNLAPEHLLDYIGAVFQDNILLNDTIFNNIHIGNPNAASDLVIKASKAAHCHEFINHLPNKYDTVISEGGGISIRW